MNIFVLDSSPIIAAESLCDRHVVKMALESAQLLCTAAHALGFSAPYKPTHAAHPCSRWLLAGRENLAWMIDHTYAIFSEYTRRYGRQHASQDALRPMLRGPFYSMQRTLPPGTTPFAQAMPDQYRGSDAVAAYRAYYIGDKSRFATWREPSEPPAWWPARQSA